MEFNSTKFIFFFTAFYLVYYGFAVKGNARKWILLAGSLVFYFLLCNKAILVLAAMALSDYLFGKAIANTKNEQVKKRYLYTAVFADISAILLFRHITDWLNLGDLAFWPSVIGISFFAFRSIGYVLDVYNETIEEPVTSFTDYLAYLSFFPLILVGPISPGRDFFPQLQKPFDRDAVQSGKAVFFLISGILKKYILANYLAVNFVDRVFDNAHLFTGVENIFATVGQALVVYLDFSGYTDFVMGISLLLGFEIANNFNFPYISQNITEYWRRWHMSLSKWLNEYLYFPLSFGLRKWKKTGTVFAVFLTFVISGFWHGTAFHYTFWGMLHGLAMAWDIFSAPMRDTIKKFIPKGIYAAISMLLTFAFLSLSGIFFKTETKAGIEMLQHIFTHTDWSFFPIWVKQYPWVFGIITTVLLTQFVFNEIWDELQSWFANRGAVVLSVLLTTTIFVAYQISGMDSLPFIYLEF